MRYHECMANQNIPKVQAVAEEPTWLERLAKWAGITSHSAFIGWTAKTLGVYVTIIMVLEKRLEQALFGIIVVLLGELIMVTAQRLDALRANHNSDMRATLDTLHQSMEALQRQKTTTTLRATVTIDGRELESSHDGLHVVASRTETTSPQDQDNPVVTSQ